jgi:hypothetical protein
MRATALRRKAVLHGIGKNHMCHGFVKAMAHGGGAQRQAVSPANAVFRSYPATFEAYACIAGTIRGSAAQILNRRCPNISRKAGYGTGFFEQLLRGYLIVNNYFQGTYKMTLGIFTALARRLLLLCAVGARCADSERGASLADPRRYHLFRFPRSILLLRTPVVPAEFDEIWLLPGPEGCPVGLDGRSA